MDAGGRELSLKAALCSPSIIDCVLVWQEALQKIRQKNTMRREVTVELSSQGFWKSGIRSDVCQVTRTLANPRAAVRLQRPENTARSTIIRSMTLSSKYPAYASFRVQKHTPECARALLLITYLKR